MMLFFLLFCIFPLAFCQTALKKYFIVEDYFNGVKPSEFTIYDSTENIKHYRIESHFSFLASFDLVSYPSKTVVGKLKKKLSLIFYKAGLSILDEDSQGWINGTIEANFHLLKSKFSIEWNHRRLIMVPSMFSRTIYFYDEQQPKTIIAEFRKRFGFFSLVNKFDMEIYVNDLPDGIFLLGLVVKDLHQKKAKTASHHGSSHHPSPRI